MSTSLCKLCFYYNHGDATCARSIAAVSPGKVHHDHATCVRVDTLRCGPDGKWFVYAIAKDGLSIDSESY
jgi:hypothetical protein